MRFDTPFFVVLCSHVKLTKLLCHAQNRLSLHDELQIDYGLGGADAKNPQTIEIPKTGPLTIAPGSPGRAETNLMNPPTLKIQTKHTLADTCANKNVDPKSPSCVVLVHTVQGGKKVAMMTSPIMLTGSALVLACFTHGNALCNKEEGALAFEKVVRSFQSIHHCLLMAAQCTILSRH